MGKATPQAKGLAETPMSVYAILDLVGVVIGLVVTAASGFIVLRG